MMKQITLREAYDWLYLEEGQPDGLTTIEGEHLLLFLEQRYHHEKVIEYSNKKIRFINLVGVIQLKSVRIEILPKIDLDKEDEHINRRVLLNMLSITKKLPVALSDQTLSAYEKVDLIHILANLFITELNQSLHRGLYREYRSTTDNLPHLRGRLLVPEHIRKNARGSVNAFCEFDELSPNILVNQVLKAALTRIYPYVQHSTLKTKMMNSLERLEDVDNVLITPFMLEPIQLNRQNRHYEVVLQLARAILHSTSMSSEQHNQIAFSFLFKMNDLFEGYIGELLKKLAIASTFELHTQHTEKRLLINVNTGRENILLKPDFVLSTHDSVHKVIIDTKWKRIIANSQLMFQQSDIYQMYAYITAYPFAERCIILYPKTEEALLPKWKVPDSSPTKYIEIRTVRLDTLQHTLEDLEGMLEGIGNFKGKEV